MNKGVTSIAKGLLAIGLMLAKGRCRCVAYLKKQELFAFEPINRKLLVRALAFFTIPLVFEVQAGNRLSQVLPDGDMRSLLPSLLLATFAVFFSLWQEEKKAGK